MDLPRQLEKSSWSSSKNDEWSIGSLFCCDMNGAFGTTRLNVSLSSVVIEVTINSEPPWRLHARACSACSRDVVSDRRCAMDQIILWLGGCGPQPTHLALTFNNSRSKVVVVHWSPLRSQLSRLTTCPFSPLFRFLSTATPEISLHCFGGGGVKRHSLTHSLCCLVLCSGSHCCLISGSRRQPANAVVSDRRKQTSVIGTGWSAAPASGHTTACMGCGRASWSRVVAAVETPI